MFMMNKKVIFLRLQECVSVVPLKVVSGFGTERGYDWRSENLSLGEDMDGGLRYGFGPNLTHGQWLYVHIGADMEIVTVVVSRYLAMASENIVTILTIFTVFQRLLVLLMMLDKLLNENVEIVNVIRDAIECANDQLRTIAEWPKLAMQDEDATRLEVIRQLRVIPELSGLDRARCLRKLMQNLADMKAFLVVPEEMKMDYCKVILQDDA
ncbi:retrotransposon protein [Cucumis melo var. makuwa]|uniref:Retrotransposon protein n=2 Tax=Cucumis melo TaxID=3656 RepID=A0A5A7UUF7_CUCMM|nr:retrotransposon protein [Cucumis melo var. makuwa]TYK11255.1 retrotransposon protein [Cucumis melo var. makuwa]